MLGRRPLLGLWFLIGTAFATPGAVAQAPSPGVPAPGAVESAPLPPPGPQGVPPAPIPPGPPSATIVQPPAPGAAPPPVVAGRPTLIPEAGDPSNVDEVVLPQKPAIIVSGTSSWDDGLKNLKAAAARMEAELAKAGLAPAGRPLAVFTQTTDDNFRFDAMLPIGAAPSPAPALPSDMRFGTTPTGKAYRFVHKGAYEEIDTTYETITTYLDVKEVQARDEFIEEYVNDIADPNDTNLEVNIFVQPR